MYRFFGFADLPFEITDVIIFGEGQVSEKEIMNLVADSKQPQGENKQLT